ncbi:uncharacterized protein BYT42DRAFT_614487 [Radiomyces spectabilis]|uniref:uncharacterized protein n=1 Tax=Radiomyces spectabilis TaxID=64574 RepID=UPI002220F3A0|nr:uncharacterized protein BYT42DRAFT_614487 [Radiomyces spectabilis]KAI8377835.1 hypothetical protein BYT42DRAFT_614487 [Radiomyces spectabilis]
MTSSHLENRSSRSMFSFGDDMEDDDQIINSVKPLPNQAVDRSLFQAPQFDPDHFLSSRRHLGLERLKKELNEHLRFLKAELVELINEDYQDFINLSTNLKGVDKAMDDLQRPLAQMGNQVQTAQSQFQDVLDKLRDELDHRTQVREKKASLKLLLNIHNSITKVEDLLEINADAVHSRDAKRTNETEAAHHSLGKQIERVAIEYNQMQYLVGRGKDLPLVAENEWRIKRIKDILQKNLSTALSAALVRIEHNDLDPPTKQSLIQCLRAYALIDQTYVAEYIIRDEFVRPFLAKTVTKKALEVPRGKVDSTCHPLSLVYKNILSFASTDLQPILEITQRTLKGTNYEVLVNTLWVEVMEFIQRDCASIFAAGQTDTFHKNYTASMNFVTEIENLCVSKRSLLYLRNHLSYAEFMKRWQLPVYFQLRFREIVGHAETLLSDLQASSDTLHLKVENELALPGTKAIAKAIRDCWSDNVFIYGLSHRFWKLTLQLLKRYQSWVVDILDHGSDTSGDKEKPGSNPSSRSSTSGSQLSDGTIIEEAASLRLFLILTHDINNLIHQIKKLAPEVIFPKLPHQVQELSILQESMESILNELDTLTANELQRRITGLVSRRCMESLKHVRSITSQYRHTNKPPPSEPSFFIPNLFRPFSNFVQQNQQWIDADKLSVWAFAVTETVVHRYTSTISDLLTNLKKTEDSLKKLKKGKKGPTAKSSVLGGGANETTMSDEDKIRLQMLLDVRQIGKEMALLSVDPTQFAAYDKLCEVVQPFESLEPSNTNAA